MTTEARTVANRLNAQKSTGPQTPEGKAVVSQNALKHGLSARRDVIITENQAEFDIHRIVGCATCCTRRNYATYETKSMKPRPVGCATCLHTQKLISHSCEGPALSEAERARFPSPVLVIPSLSRNLLNHPPRSTPPISASPFKIRCSLFDIRVSRRPAPFVRPVQLVQPVRFVRPPPYHLKLPLHPPR